MTDETLELEGSPTRTSDAWMRKQVEQLDGLNANFSGPVPQVGTYD